MSSRRRTLQIVSGVAALLVGSVGAGAQEPLDPESKEARLEAEIARLAPEVEFAQDRMRWEKTVMRNALRSAPAVARDTLRIGAIRMIAVPERSPEARRAAEAVWDDVGPWFGRRGASLSDAVFVADPDQKLDRVRFAEETYPLRGREWPGRGYSQEQLTRDLRQAMAQEVSHDAPQPFQRWADLNRLFMRDDRQTRENLYREMVLSTSPIVQACVDGDEGACWSALGLRAGPAAVTEWYARDRIRSAQGGNLLRAQLWSTCGLGEEAGCEEFLTSSRWLSTLPASAALRSSVLSWALQQGGGGSLERLLQGWPEADSTRLWDQRVFANEVRERIVAASGTGAGDFIEGWRAHILQTRPQVHVVDERERLGTALWFLFFAFFAMRSTRWRLG